MNADLGKMFSSVDGVLIAYENSRRIDPNKPSCPDNWSGMVWRIWTRFCVTVTPETTDFSGLIYVFWYSIDNLDQRDPRRGPCRCWTPEDTSLENAFWPLLGSLNSSGSIYIQTNHKVALKGKGVESIGAMHDPVDGDENGQYEAYMWATLGRPE